MSHREPFIPGERKRRKPLDSAALDELALAYAARFATSAVKLERYLVRKLRERGWEGAGEPDVAGVVARMVEHRYVDDAAFAQARGGGLLRRGYGPRRVAGALAQAGIAAELREKLAPGEGAKRQAVLTFARKRGFGPFGPDRPDRAQREKQLAAMLRAGHTLDSAREMVDAASVEAAEQWVAEAVEEEG